MVYTYTDEMSPLYYVGVCACLIRDPPYFQVYNLGTGNGLSVLDMVKAFENASGKKVINVHKDV